MSRNSNLFSKFFGVIAESQTYLNYLYLFLAFPLGLIYFIFLVVGISVGLATLILWVGLLVLLIVVGGWWLLAGFERVMAISLLHVNIPPMTTPKSEKAQTSLEKLGAFLSNPVTWKGLIFLLLKFPLGILSFTVLVALTTITLVLITSPFTYHFVQPEIWLWGGTVMTIDTLGEAFIGMIIGFFMIFISLHIFNGLAWLSGKIAQFLLGNPQPVLAAASAQAVVPEPAPTRVAPPAETEAPRDPDKEELE